MRIFVALMVVLVLSGVLAAKAKKEKYKHWSLIAPLTSKTMLGPYQMVELNSPIDHKTYSCVLAEPDARFYLFHIGDTVGVTGQKQDSSIAGRSCYVIIWQQKK